MSTIAVDYSNFSRPAGPHFAVASVAGTGRRRQRTADGGRPEQLQNLAHVVLRLGIRRDAAEALHRRLAGVVGREGERQAVEPAEQHLQVLDAGLDVRAGSYGLATAYRRAVSGINCIRPIAPFRDRASAWYADSTLMTARTSRGSTPSRTATSSMIAA